MRGVTGLDPFELFLRAHPHGAFEPLVGGEHVPAAEEKQRSSDSERCVVRQIPVEARVARRLFAVADMIRAFKALTAARRGEVRADVTSAEPLSDAQTAALREPLRLKMRRPAISTLPSSATRAR